MVYSLLRQIRMGKLHEPLDPSFSNKRYIISRQVT